MNQNVNNRRLEDLMYIINYNSIVFPPGCLDSLQYIVVSEVWLWPLKNWLDMMIANKLIRRQR